MPPSRTRVIRTVADLAQLGEDELANCLKALRCAIQERKRIHAAALSAGDLAPGTPLEFNEFSWRPTDRNRMIGASGYSADSPIADLPLRHQVKRALLERNIYCLEDLSEMTEFELRRLKDAGVMTVERVRELLAEVDLDFKAETEPARAASLRSRALRKMTPARRAEVLQGMGDEESIARLGLRDGTLKRAMAHKIMTIGDLRRMTPRSIAHGFGRNEGRELLAALEATGTGLKSDPGQLELWRLGLMRPEQLVRPESPTTPVEELAPWINFAITPLKKAGISTLGALVERAKPNGLVGIRGLGMTHRARILEFLGEPQEEVAPTSGEASSAVSSVFDLGRRGASDGLS